MVTADGNGGNGEKKTIFQTSSYSDAWKTRPDTWQDSRGRLGRSRDAKTARNPKKFVTDLPTYRHTDIPTYRPTDRHGKVQSRVSATKNTFLTNQAQNGDI